MNDRKQKRGSRSRILLLLATLLTVSLMMGALAVSASAAWKWPAYYSITVTPKTHGGTVDIEGIYFNNAYVEEGTEVTAIATPLPNFGFVRWEEKDRRDNFIPVYTDEVDDEGNLILAGAEYTFPASKHIVLFAVFEFTGCDEPVDPPEEEDPEEPEEPIK